MRALLSTMTRFKIGMDVALKSMSIGERAMFRFRSDYAYGEEGSPERGTSPAIPGGASIEFELEVVDGVSMPPLYCFTLSCFGLQSAIDTGATDRKNIQKQKLLEVSISHVGSCYLIVYLSVVCVDSG